jgi:hypothetical protein
MIPRMSGEQKTTIESELEMLEKLHKLGDQEGALIIARRLLISQTLSEDEKRRIDRVINADKIKAANLVTIILVVLVVLYLYLRYGT